MSKAYQFPDDPQRPNPFADPAALPADSSDNPYLASIAAQETHEAASGQYKALSHRGVQLMTFAGLGLIVFLASLPFAYFCSPLGALMAVLNFGLTIPAWIMGRQDLKAIRAGAVDPAGKGLTKTACQLGFIGSIGNLLSFALGIYMSLPEAV
jgi:hypothetical protein